MMKSPTAVATAGAATSVISVILVRSGPVVSKALSIAHWADSTAHIDSTTTHRLV